MSDSIKDSAQDLGVCLITVSTVLQNYTGLRGPTREQVLKRVKAGGYQTNAYARSLWSTFQPPYF